MNYLYSETLVSNPISSILMTSNLIITHHHSTIRIYDHSLQLLHEKYFYEKILEKRKINDSSFIILFDENKLVQLTYDLEAQCLRYIEGNNMDVYNNTAIVYNKLALSYFNVNEELVNKIYYNQLGIRNVQKIIFLINYIPTILIAWKDKDRNRCSILNLDGGTEVIEDFDILDGLIKIKSFDRFIVLLYRNYIQIRFKRETSTLLLHSDLDLSTEANIIFDIKDPTAKEKTMGNSFISLEDPELFIKDDCLFVINGSGDIYKISMKVDVKKILRAEVSFEGKTTEPSCIDIVENKIVVGSLKNDTVLYELEESTMNLKEIKRLKNSGLIHNIYVKNNSDIVFTTNRRILITNNTIKFEILEKIKLGIKPSKLKITDKSFILSNNEGLVEIDRESKKQTALKMDHEATSKDILDSLSYDTYDFVYYSNMNLVVYQNKNIITKIEDVHAFSAYDDFLVYSSSQNLSIFSLSKKTHIFSSTSIHVFRDKIPNDEFWISKNLEEVNSTESSNIESKLADQVSVEDNGIIEILMRKEQDFLIFIRTNRQLYLYKYYNNELNKIFIPKYLTFGINNKCLYNMHDFIYIKSKIPYCVFTMNGIFMQRSNYKFVAPCSINNDLYFVYKGYLIRTKLPESRFVLNYNSSLIIKEVEVSKDIDSNINNNKNASFIQKDTVLDSSDPNIIKQISDVENEEHPSLRHLVYTNDCVIMSSCKYSSFKFVPFIPMVHLSAGPDGLPQSEPINKDEIVNTKPLVRGRTLRYSIDLYSLKYQFMSSIDLEENELVCDLKFLFDNFIIVCTSFCEGEEKLVKGRLIVYSLVDIVPDPQFPFINKKLKLISSEQFKSPCLFCEAVRGNLAVCIGTRLMIYEININTGITAVGRNEISLLTTSLFIIKNYILVSDIYKGIHFYFLRPRDPLKLHLLGQSDSINNVRHVQGFVYSKMKEMGKSKHRKILSGDSKQKDILSLVSYDKYGSIYIYTYSPLYDQSNNGTRLIKRSEINTKIPSLLNSNATQMNLNTSLFISNNILVAIRAIDSSKIRFVSNCIAMFVRNSCGINLRNYLEPVSYSNVECKSAVSERMLLEFFYLDAESQKKVLEAIGCNYSELIEIFNEVFN